MPKSEAPEPGAAEIRRLTEEAEARVPPPPKVTVKGPLPDPVVEVLGAERAAWLAEAHLAAGDAAVWAWRFREVAVDLARANLALRQTREVLDTLAKKKEPK